MSVLDNLKTLLSAKKGLNARVVSNYRYPLGDEQKYQAIVKFTAMARDKKSSVTDFSKPVFVESKLGSVSLYMPAGLQINDNLSYDNVDTGLGGMLVNAAQDSASTSEFIKSAGKSLPQIGDRFVSAKLAELSQSKGLVGGAAGQLLINRGEVINPHQEMLFRSPALRQFNFTFKMIARSKAESKEIKNIVKFFREAAYPELGQEQGDPTQNKSGPSFNMTTYRFPDKFKIQYFFAGQENKNLIKFNDSYITAVTVNYNQQSPTFFEDGMPSEVDLSLTFQETKALSRSDIQKGF